VVVCETARLTLRWFEPGDLEALAAIHDDPEVIRYVGGPERWAGGRAADRLAEYIEEYGRFGFSKWAVIVRATGALAGRCGPVVETIEGRQEIELGCVLGRAHWGAGYATEVVSAALEHCFSVLGRSRIVSLVDPANVGSQRLAARLHMKHERDVEWRGRRMRLYVAEQVAP
jgi:[ribosomal protein S5]-alanine N-acetyltransferase